MFVILFVISIYIVLLVSLEQSEYLVANKFGSLSVFVKVNDITSQDIIVEVTVTNGTALGEYIRMYIHKPATIILNCLPATIILVFYSWNRL